MKKIIFGLFAAALLCGTTFANDAPTTEPTAPTSVNAGFAFDATSVTQTLTFDEADRNYVTTFLGTDAAKSQAGIQGELKSVTWIFSLDNVSGDAMSSDNHLVTAGVTYVGDGINISQLGYRVFWTLGNIPGVVSGEEFYVGAVDTTGWFFDPVALEAIFGLGQEYQSIYSLDATRNMYEEVYVSEGGWSGFANNFTLSPADLLDVSSSPNSTDNIGQNYVNYTAAGYYDGKVELIYTYELKENPPVVPEPATLVLLGLGALAAPFARRFRK